MNADVCVVGCGPAGITLARELVAAGARVTIVESGLLDEHPAATSLIEGDADGPVLKGYPSYLRDSRRAQVGGSGAGWGRGGRLWCMPFGPIDFAARGWVPGSGWPIRGEVLEPYLRRAAAALLIEPFTPPDPVAGPLIAHTYQYPVDSGVLRREFLRLTEEDPARAQLGATVVGFEARGGRVTAARCVRLDGTRTEVHADAFVLAGGGIENARMLLLQGVTNALTGRYFMEHFHVFAGTVRLPDAAAWREYLDPTGPRMRVLGLTDEAQRDARLLNLSVQLMPEDDRTADETTCGLMVRAEQAPNPDSRVRLGESTDRLGRRTACLTWATTPQDWRSVVRGARIVADALEAEYGASVELLIDRDEPWPWEPAGPAASPRPTWGNHHMGTTRMSADPADGVVDPDCRMHGTENLYVAGSSVFPTGSFANPTYTIVALAIRLADHIAGVRSGVPAQRGDRLGEAADGAERFRV